MNRTVRSALFLVFLACSPLLRAGALQVIEPDGVGDRIAEGADYSTYVIGDRWDMSGVDDIVIEQTTDIDQLAFSNGVISFRTVTNDARLWLLFPGLNRAIRVDEGERFPIDTSTYSQLAVKIRLSNPAGGPLPDTQFLQVFFYENAESIQTGMFGFTGGKVVNDDGWQIITIDLPNFEDVNSNFEWLDFSMVRGIRLDPTNRPNVDVEIDWVRLVDPASANTGYTVTWNGNGAGSYDVTAVDGDGARLPLGTTSGTSLNADFSWLPPGDFTVEVSGGGDTDTSSGPVRVNEAPIVHLTEPDIRGDTGMSYAAVETGNPWGPIDAGDISATADISNISYSNPAGSFSGRATTADPRITMNTPVSIDTALYRLLCFTAEVQGLRDSNNFAPARILWGNNPSQLSTSEDIVLDAGLKEYCVGDMTQIIQEPEAFDFGPWIGSIDFLRFDPHEIPPSAACQSSPTPFECRDIQLASLTLAPYDNANPNFSFEWEGSDADDSPTISIFADADRIAGNGNEIQVATGLSGSPGGSVSWNASAVADGTYEAYVVATDGLNSITRYATGQLVVGDLGTNAITVQQPDGLNDVVPPGRDFAAEVVGDRWDFSQATDVDLGRSQNLSSESIAGGIYTGTASSNDPFIFLLHPQDSPPPVPTSEYRFLNAKVRMTNVAGPHFFIVTFYRDATFSAGSFGFTDAKVVDSTNWEIISFDLNTEISSQSALSWTELSQAAGMRIDPTNKSGTRIEIDWITLTSAPTSETSYTFEWSASDLTGSTIDVELVDADGARFTLGDDLPGNTRQLTADLSKLFLGDYNAQIIATPGGVGVSSGPVTISEINPDVVFSNGFE